MTIFSGLSKGWSLRRLLCLAHPSLVARTLIRRGMIGAQTLPERVIDWAHCVRRMPWFCFDRPSVRQELCICYVVAPPSINHPALSKFDDIFKVSIQRITNCDFSDLQWIQASLPVRDGGLGIWRVASLALPAFLALAASTLLLQADILSSCTPSDNIFPV